MAARFVRYANALASGYSFLASSISGIPVLSGMPLFLSAELTNHCNLNCPECASGSGMLKRKRGFMDPALYKKVLNETSSYLNYLNLYFQGEPMLHPDFFSFLEPVKGVRTAVSTNGHFLTHENSERIARSGLGKLIVSLDGMDPETYSEYRKGGDFSRVISGIRNVADAREKWKSSLKLEIQFLINRNNENQTAQVRLFAKETGAILRLKSMQVINSGDAYKWLPSEQKYVRYRKEGGGYVVKGNLPDRCARLWFNPVITWDGKVVPCCFDKDEEYVMGDLTKESFRAVWNGGNYDRFRRLVLTGRKNIDICRNCTSGLKGVRC